jgi:hypothetical protein
MGISYGLREAQHVNPLVRSGFWVFEFFGDVPDLGRAVVPVMQAYQR